MMRDVRSGRAARICGAIVSGAQLTTASASARARARAAGSAKSTVRAGAPSGARRAAERDHRDPAMLETREKKEADPAGRADEGDGFRAGHQPKRKARSGVPGSF